MKEHGAPIGKKEEGTEGQLAAEHDNPARMIKRGKHRQVMGFENALPDHDVERGVGEQGNDNGYCRFFHEQPRQAKTELDAGKQKPATAGPRVHSRYNDGPSNNRVYYRSSLLKYQKPRARLAEA